MSFRRPGFARTAGIGAALVLSAGACRAEEAISVTAPSVADIGHPDRVPSTEDVFGYYALKRATGEGACRIALNRVPEPVGYGVVLGRCDLDVVRGATSWRPVAGGFELLRGSGPALRFRQTGVDDFETVDGAYRLSRAPMA